ncbi:MAG: HD domain-containing protein [Actinomycetota bacterium]
MPSPLPDCSPPPAGSAGERTRAGEPDPIVVTGVVAQSFHLVRRFAGSIRPGPPKPADEDWAKGSLVPGERELWARMSNPDRRHAVTVARDVVRRWPEVGDGEPPRAVVAAALLHDVGKVESGLRTPERVAATLLWSVLDDSVAARWATTESRVLGRYGRYRRHPEIGGALLRSAGADPLTAAWAEEHHRPDSRWTVDHRVGQLLKACDDD